MCTTIYNSVRSTVVRSQCVFVISTYMPNLWLNGWRQAKSVAESISSWLEADSMYFIGKFIWVIIILQYDLVV